MHYRLISQVIVILLKKVIHSKEKFTFIYSSVRDAGAKTRGAPRFDIQKKFQP